MRSSSGPGRKPHALGIARMLVGAFAIGAFFEVIGIPAGMLLGAIIGAALSNQPWTTNWRPSSIPRNYRSVGLIILGAVTGAMLTWESLASLTTIVVPVAVCYFALGAVNTLFSWVLMKRYKMGPATAVFSLAPGGFGEVLGLAVERDANLPVILSVHAVRIILLVLIILPTLFIIL